MKWLCFVTIALCVMSCGSSHRRASVPTDPYSKVWVCTGDCSERYHAYDNCKGLSNCRASVEEVSLQEAENMGRTPCRKCYRQ